MPLLLVLAVESWYQSLFCLFNIQNSLALPFPSAGSLPVWHSMAGTAGNCRAAASLPGWGLPTGSLGAAPWPWMLRGEPQPSQIVWWKFAAVGAGGKREQKWCHPWWGAVSSWRMSSNVLAGGVRDGEGQICCRVVKCEREPKNHFRVRK